MTESEVLAFQQFIRRWFLKHGRLELPWRQTSDPYTVLVSELMLQQTQVERVVPKFETFIQRFPSVQDLAAASLAEVLKLWQGLGYNRRAKYLHQAAQSVVTDYQGQFPKDVSQLQQLPGIGSYTAAAILNFAFNRAIPLIETNVRTVFLYHFFPLRTEVSDANILQLVTQTLDVHNPREWFWALMDYGSYLKKTIGNPNPRSKQYSRQSRFSGSLRQVRGEIIRVLTEHDELEVTLLASLIKGNALHFPGALQQLLSEQMVVEENNHIKLAE